MGAQAVGKGSEAPRTDRFVSSTGYSQSCQPRRLTSGLGAQNDLQAPSFAGVFFVSGLAGLWKDSSPIAFINASHCCGETISLVPIDIEGGLFYFAASNLHPYCDDIKKSRSLPCLT